MQDSKHAILMTPNALGWTWELINADGVTIAKGDCVDQEGAMDAAWRAARSPSDAKAKDFPEFVVSRPKSDGQGPRSRAEHRRRP